MGKPYVYHRAEDLGIPVQDGKERVFVGVTESDIVNAKKANSQYCAFSRAAMRLPGVNAAYFFRKTAFLEYKDKIVKYTLPPSAQKEIVSFDRAQVFAPDVYQLSPPAPSDRIANQQHKNRRAVLKRSKQAGKPYTTGSSKTERASLAAAIAKVAESEPKSIDTPEQLAFEAQLTKITGIRTPKGKHHRSTVGVVGPLAPAPLMPSGSNKFIRRTQYIRDLRDPNEE